MSDRRKREYAGPWADARRSGNDDMADELAPVSELDLVPDHAVWPDAYAVSDARAVLDNGSRMAVRL
jgi:hypothetical protein